MGRHDRDDGRDSHHSSRQHSEDKYSLQELKYRARREDRSNHSRSDDHRRPRDDRDVGRRRRNHSRSASPVRHHRQNRDDRRRSRSRSPGRGGRDYPKSNNGRERRDQNEFKQPQHNFDKPKGDFQRRKNDDGYGPPNDDKPTEGPPPEIKPNFELTGNLSKDTNMFNGVLVKYHEPAEAKKPRKEWRFYPFKGDTPLDYIPIHRQSAYLFGRDRRVADIPVDHPSCSKQHAVLQYRSIEIERDDGTKARVTRPYIIDLDSGNGTFVNNKQIEARRYVELMERDVVKFGFSTREYVLLHDKSQNEEQGESDTEQ